LKRRARRNLKILQQFQDLSNKTCLEIGCATGEFCHTLRKYGVCYAPVGIDLSRDIIDAARARYKGIDFRHGDITSLEDSEVYDVIFAFEVIEHVTSPREFLRGVLKHLNPEGILVLSTPNLDCGRRIGISRWSGFLSSFEHLYFFSLKTLSSYAEDMDLHVVGGFTGGGNGLSQRSKQSGRQKLRTALVRSRLFGLIVDVRDLFGHSPYGSIKEPHLHTLYMLLKKP